MDPLRENAVMRVARNTIIGNILLSIFKLIAGVAGHSTAMVSDAVHSLSDVASTAVVMIGVKMAGKEADKDHPYGHEHFEAVAAIILAAMLCATGLGIGYGGVRAITAEGRESLAAPGLSALFAAAASILVKEGMYWYTRAAAKRTASDALMADAWHHRSDALSSIGSFAGILGARMGFPILDPVAALVICFFIVKAAYAIFCEAVGKMTDRSMDDDALRRIRALVLEQKGVDAIDRLRTRVFGDKAFVELEISMDGDMTLRQTHETAHQVHDLVETTFPGVKHCMVHVNPSECICRTPEEVPSQNAEA